MEADDLYSVKNNFWLGNYADAIEEARSLRIKGDALRVERDAFIYRAMLALKKYSTVIQEIGDDAPLALQGVKLLAQYQSNAAGRSRVVAAVDGLLSDPVAVAEPTMALMLACILQAEERYGDALRALKSAGSGPEQLALSTQLYLRLDRPDLAEKSLKPLQSLDDESVLYQLTLGWLCLAQGGDRYKEASLVFRDILDRHGPCLVGLNGAAAAAIALRRFEDADRAVQEAMALAEGVGGDATTLVNAIALAAATGRGGPEATAKLVAKLREVDASHPYVNALSLAESAFDRVAATYGL